MPKIKVLASDEGLLAVSSPSGGTRKQESPFRMVNSPLNASATYTYPIRLNPPWLYLGLSF